MFSIVKTEETWLVQDTNNDYVIVECDSEEEAENYLNGLQVADEIGQIYQEWREYTNGGCLGEFTQWVREEVKLMQET